MLKDQLIKQDDHHSELFQKEIFALKNDLYYQFFENANSRWFFDISYKPHQTLSGDTYSLRQIGEDKFFIFLVDAMGKGLNASITSIMSATFLNYVVDTQKEKDCFNLENIIKQYLKYIQTSIFDDEIVSASFIIFDFKTNKMQSAIFGIPPILLQNMDNSLKKIKANNLPISKYSCKINITTHDLTDVKKLLIYTDGLNETIIDNSHMYKDYMDQDFLNASNYKDFLEMATKRVETFDDDMTFLYIEKESYNKCKIENFSIESRQNELEPAMHRVEEFLLNNGLTPKNEAYMSNAFMEMLLNAYEHGNLEIDHNEKSRSLETGTFDDLLQERELRFEHRKIHVNIHIKKEHHITTFKIGVLDEGKGFDTSIIKNKFSKNKLYNGRGLIMVSKMVDAFYYNHKGNQVILKKFQKRTL